MQRYWVYFVGSENRQALYIGVTNNLIRRIIEHKAEEIPGFTKRYHCTALLYYEEFSDIRNAIAREKQLKGWTRQKKEELIASMNPRRIDLAAE